ncbi:PilN domain-containing protein [Oharaeibacter diazotrophicus]|uniref:General secretion pathway protein L n=2 Tax=Oharaeibacter diazotrophicus TaxID=1920512 RepID=A0A4R6R6J0_9HYPH|nr:PilN domain-containing protein [Oharaeibacter diazotrophicus]TDP81452.1 general secretion pathway protein L [Oharaeibacter diazotrophicus]BBE73690.1 fimbrial assembly protein PilN [Pleomorphomonas sp. SM30]GLS75479.1 hypothetical protein GCM10007904_08140 [Oharaeibacter diazotrophicus]
MGQISGTLAKLVDAFVEVVAPVFGRFVSSSRIVAVEADGGLALYAVRRGRAEPVGTAETAAAKEIRRLKRAGGAAVELRLAPKRVLTRTLELPAAGREYLEPIIEHRLERLTPWRPDRVLFGYAAGTTAGEGTMTVEFAATSSDLAAPAVARLEALDLAPTALGSAAEPIATPLRVDLYRGRRDVGRVRLRRGVVVAVALLGLSGVGALAAGTVLTGLSDQRLAELDKRLLTKRAVLRAAAGAGRTEGRDKELIEAKTPATSLVVLIDRLSRAVPDDTYLRELSIEGPKVRLVGFSADAPALIGLLDADPGLSDVRFAAPVTRTDDGRDSFDIVAVRDVGTPGGETAAVDGAAPAAGGLP